MTDASVDAETDRARLFPPGVKIVALYDGHCGLCRASVQFLQARDREHRIHPVALQTPGVLALLHISSAEAEGVMHAFGRNGEHRSGADAVLWAISLLPRFGALRGVWSLPGVMPVARFVYGQIAKRRSRTVCEGDSCRAH